MLEPVSEKTLTVESPQNSHEAARIARLKKAVKAVVDGFIVDAAVNGVTDESFAAFRDRLAEAGCEEYRLLYQSVYDRNRREFGEVKP